MGHRVSAAKSARLPPGPTQGIISRCLTWSGGKHWVGLGRQQLIQGRRSARRSAAPGAASGTQRPDPQTGSQVSSLTPQRTQCAVPKMPIFQHPDHRSQASTRHGRPKHLHRELFLTWDSKDKTSSSLGVFPNSLRLGMDIGLKDVTRDICKERGPQAPEGCAEPALTRPPWVEALWQEGRDLSFPTCNWGMPAPVPGEACSRIMQVTEQSPE